MSSSSAPWVKLWWTWFTSRSHAGIGWEALHVGPVLMSLAKVSEQPTDADGVRWCLDAGGEPIDERAVAPFAQVTQAQAKKGIAALVKRGTLVRRDDGAVGWPNFDDYQRSPSAKRMEEKRHRDRNGKRHSDAQTDGASADKRLEVRGLEPPAVVVGHPPPHDPTERFDPELRSIGEPVDTPPTADTALERLDFERRRYTATLDAKARSRVPGFAPGGKTLQGIACALADHGWPTVLAACRHAWQRAASGHLAERLLVCSFYGAAFGLRVAEWREHGESSEQAEQRTAEAAEAERQRAATLEAAERDRGSIAAQAAAAAARFAAGAPE